ncbi:Uncharacterised protein [Mycobacterium xenopi]|uniref:Uncharacterized protein n=1 Tax=Mycobacterium xenopi TaxID=1789 RepID=A0AAD1GXS6_MYCXE|nr:hypothetical protein MYXE_04290 [Mycobacterium xenopi]SPX79455.1 Uncharacterised protein [Mycobacterium xenopi]
MRGPSTRPGERRRALSRCGYRSAITPLRPVRGRLAVAARSVRQTSCLRFGSGLARVRIDSAIAVRMAARCGLRRRKAVIGTRLRGCVPCATTIGSLPSVSTSSQSWPMPATLRRPARLSAPLSSSKQVCGPATFVDELRAVCWPGILLLRPKPSGLGTDRVVRPFVAPCRKFGTSRSSQQSVGGVAAMATDVARRGVGRHPSVNAASTNRNTATAPALSSGWLPLPHFGDCTHDGQPVGHSHASIAAAVALSQVLA